MAKLPLPSVETIRSVPPEVNETGGTLWRIHRSEGAHAIRWNQLRRFGPLPRARFDPWNDSAQRRDSGVGYFAFTWPTVLSEVFQERRRVEISSSRQSITGFTPTRDLRLLDLRHGYPIKVGASHSLNGGNRQHCRIWSHAFREALPELDGYIYLGMSSGDCVVLFDGALDAFPSRPGYSRMLSDPRHRARLSASANEIRYALDT